MTGYSRDELLAMDIIDLYKNPLDRKKILKQLALHPEKSPFEFFLREKMNRTFWFR